MNEASKKVVIVQEKLPEYRIPLFEKLANNCGLEVLVAHCDKKVAKYNFDSLYFDKISILNFHIQSKIYDYCKNADVVIIMFDIRWLSNIFLTILCRKKVLLWGHGYGRSKIGNYIRKILVKISGALIVYEENAVEEFIKSGVDSKKIFYSGNTVDVKNHGLGNSKKTQFLYVGRLQIRKKLDDFIHAFSIVHDEMPDIYSITIVGNGEIKEELISLALKLGIGERVNFIDATFNHEVLRKIYHSSLAYISPGHVGLGVLHSFAYGVPVITYLNADHAPEVENIKNMENGVFVRDKAELAEELLKLVNDSQYQNNLSSKAYNYYIAFRTMDQMVGRFLQAIDYVCKRKII